MKITGGSSYVKFDMEDGHIVIATGEMLIGGKFIVETSSMKVWEPPFENESLSIDDIEEIKKQVLTKTTEKSVQIIFE